MSFSHSSALSPARPHFLSWGPAFLAVLIGVGLASAPTRGHAQPTIYEAGITLERDIDGTGIGPVHGLSIHDESQNIYFIGDGGTDLYEGAPDGTLTQIADDVGRFVGILSDLRVGPDGLLYVGDSTVGAGDPNGDIERFERDGTFVDTFASVEIGSGSNAFGVAFDCAGDLYASETGTNLYRITPAGDVSIHSTGWVDVDEIERGENNQMFVLDGSARAAEHGTVFLHQPDGSIVRYAENVGRTHAATFDRGVGDILVGLYNAGEVVRLHDEDGSGVIEMDERTVLADGFGTIVDLDYGRSSTGTGYSIYVVANGHIYELAGFGEPRFGGCGSAFDDDGDGVCDMGQDLNGDGDCNDPGEDTEVMDCDDTEPMSSPLLSEVCNDGIDNDCDGDTDLDDSECATFDTDMDGLPDIVEIANGDSDMDGLDDFEDPDDDNDGVPTREECPDPMDCRDTDGMDGPDYLDDDDDGDGVPTMTERPGDADQHTDDDGIADHLDTDDDQDGIDTAVEIADVAALGADPDDDMVPAYLDTDSDGDGVPDSTEGRGDLDEDGVPDYLDADSSPRDSDMDGVRDDVECPGGMMCMDTDMDGTPDFEDPDDDGDGVPTVMENGGAGQDTDMDGTPDYLDEDDDGDGIATMVECEGGPRCVDTDDDGDADYLDPDDDGDGIDTAQETMEEAALGGDVDMDGLPAHLDTDADDDGVGDMLEGTGDADGDGAPNYLDADSTPEDGDGDGVPDIVECPTGMMCMDTDGDGTPDVADADDDGDGVPTRDERPGAQSVDTDGDGVADYLDDDDDGDGIPTLTENTDPAGTDVDGDGVPNYLDTDSDGDMASDMEEGTGDEDGDGVPNYLDPAGGSDATGGVSGGTGCAASGESGGAIWWVLMAFVWFGRRRRLR